MKQFTKAIVMILIALPPLSTGEADAQALERPVDMMRWQERIFRNSTTYRSVILNQERVLRAEADDSASALYQSHRIDLNETPFLHWRWRIEKSLGPQMDEHTKEGDDYPARVYVIRNGGLAFWRSKAINYVWSSGRPANTHWQNPFAPDSVYMWSLESGDKHAGQWQEQVRDIRADWLAAFGEEIESLDGLAVMTDTDNTGVTARAWYADILFSASP